MSALKRYPSGQIRGRSSSWGSHPLMLIAIISLSVAALRGGIIRLNNASYEFTDSPAIPLVEYDAETVADIQELGGCETVECVHRIGRRLEGKTKFNFPHFMLIGWQKCATSSVNSHLRSHPELLASTIKESHFFSSCVGKPGPHCRAHTPTEYLQEFLRMQDAVDAQLTMATWDASADYAMKGEVLAKRLHRLFPWMKIVIMMREPIRRAISYVNMHTQLQDARKACQEGQSLYECLLPLLNAETVNYGGYYEPLAGWLKVFPKEQVTIIQMEKLIQDPETVLSDLKIFLGIDPTVPKKAFWNVNNRAAEHPGWPMRKEEYNDLVKIVRKDALNVAGMLEEYGFCSKDSWMKNWEAIWSIPLSSCDDDGNCMLKTQEEPEEK